MIDCDILIVTAPWTATRQPLQAPAALKACVEQHDFTCSTYDINFDFVRLEDTDPKKFELCKNYFGFGTIQDKNNFSVIEIKEKNLPSSYINRSYLKSIA